MSINIIRFHLRPLAALALLLWSLPSALAAPEDFRRLVQANRATVVNITATPSGGLAGSSPRSNRSAEQLLYELLQRLLTELQGLPVPSQPLNAGSGFIISSDGYILTNAHIVNYASAINVRLSDQSDYPARLVGLDELTDIALLKIEVGDLTPVVIGDSDAVEPGEWVIAIGSPFGFEHTVTLGIVSAIGRSLPGETLVPFIQTDAAINPGNSGGPLFNARGEVIGINAQLFSRSNGSIGLSFAIPIKEAMVTAEQLRSKGVASHGWLGLGLQDLDPQLAQAFGMKQARGALITEVAPDSPAARAGLREGDVVIGFDGRPVADALRLTRMIGDTIAGTSVALEVIRNGNSLVISATVDSLLDDSLLATGTDLISGSNALLNLTLSELNTLERQQLALGQRGLLIQDIGRGPAQDAGLYPGDILLSLNHQELGSLVQFDTLLGNLPRNRLMPLLIWRDGELIYLALHLPD